MATYATANPATAAKPGYEESAPVELHKIRITLTSRNVKSLEKGTFSPRTYPFLYL